jgi:lysophospholipase L1-like esterase
MANTVITGPILDSFGQPVNGYLYGSQTARSVIDGALVTQTIVKARVIDGTPFLDDGITPLEVPSTAVDAEAFEWVEDFRPYRDQVVRYTDIPEAGPVAYAVLPERARPIGSSTWIVPGWARELVDANAGIAASVEHVDTVKADIDTTVDGFDTAVAAATQTIDSAVEEITGIDALTVRSGAVVGDNLILTRTDSTTVNAGNVRGLPGPQGAPGVNSVANDTATAAQINTPGSATDLALKNFYVTPAQVATQVAAHVPANRLGALGDSITAQNTGNAGAAGYLVWANAAVDQRLQLVIDPVTGNMFGESGKTAAQLISQGYAATAAASDAETMLVFAGTNDIGTDRSPADAMASLLTIWQTMLASGKRVIACTVLPRNDTIGLADLALQAARIRELNRLIRNQARSMRGVYLCDWHAAMIDPATGTMRVGYAREGLHPTVTGAAVMGAILAPILEAMFPPIGDARLPGTNDEGPLGNSLMLGTTGIKTSGDGTASGSVATGWTLIYTGGAGGTVVASKVPRSDFWPGELQRIVHAPTAGIGGRSYLRATSSNLGTLAVGDYFSVAAEVEIEGFVHVEIVVDFTGASGTATALSIPTEYRQALTLPLPKFAGVLRSAARSVPAGATQFRVTINFYGPGSINVGRVGIAKTPQYN